MMSIDDGQDGVPEAATSTQRLEDGLAQLSFEVMGRLSLLAAEEGLSLTQLRLLAVLRGRSPRMAQLAGALGLDRSSITGLIDRAEQRGLVVRRASEVDRRAVQVELTDAGRAFADRVAAVFVVRLADLVEPLDGASRAHLTRMLTAMLPSG